MKTINMFKAALCAVLGLSLVACTEEAYVPAPQEDASKTYVRVDETAARSLDVDGTDILVPFVRNNASGALDVTVALADTSGLFTLKSTTVSFAAGETTATAAVSYSYDALDPNSQYAISVCLTSEDVMSQYTAVNFPVVCKKAWKKLGVGQFADLYFIGIISEKEFIQSPDGTQKYRMLNPFTKDEIAAAGCTFEKEIPYIEFTIGEDGSVSWGYNFSTGFGYGGYSIYYANPDWYNGNTAAAADNAVVGENLIQICYTAMAVSGGSIAGSYGTGYAYISLPGGPNLADLL
jgi:hypothetical protein